MAVITGTARPGEFLVSDTAGQWAINGLPLIGHTGYRLLVPWAAVPGDLITQGEVSNTVPVPAYDADAADYFSRAEGIGGSFLSAGAPGWYIKWRIDAMYRRLKDTGAWAGIAELYLMMGVGFGGLSAKAKYIATPDITWYSFASADYAATGEAAGLTGAEGKYGDTSVQPYSQVSAHIGVGAIVETFPSEGSLFGTIIGNLGIAHAYTINARISADGGDWESRLKTGSARVTLSPSLGANTELRQGDSVRHIAGATAGSTVSLPVSGSSNASTLNIFRRANSSSPQYYDGRLSAIWVTDGATPQQIIDLHAATSGLRDDLSRPNIAPASHAPIVIRFPMKDVLQGSTGNRATVRLIDSYGEPLTGISAGDVTITAGPEGGTAVPVAVSGSWTERADGRYDFSMPDAMYTGTQRIFVEGTIDGGTVLGDCHQIVGYDRLEPWATPADIAAIGAVIPGDDAQTLTLTCTADSQPVAGVVIRIAGRRLVTDTAGVATVDLDPGSYTARYTPPAGFDAVPDAAVTIAAAPVSLLVSLAETDMPTGVAPVCVTRFLSRTQFTQPAIGLAVKVEFRGFVGPGPHPAVVVNLDQPLKITGPDGYVDADLYRNAQYTASFHSGTGRSKPVDFTTPDAGSYIVTEPA